MSDTATAMSNATLHAAASANNLTLADVAEAATANNVAPAPADPIEQRLQAIDQRMQAIEALIGAVAPAIGAALPAAAPLLSRLSNLETGINALASFAARAEPSFAAMLRELWPKG